MSNDDLLYGLNGQIRLAMFERIGGFLDSCLAVGLLIIFALPIAAIGLVIAFVQQIYDKVLGKENPPDGGPDPKQ